MNREIASLPAGPSVPSQSAAKARREQVASYPYYTNQIVVQRVQVGLVAQLALSVGELFFEYLVQPCAFRESGIALGKEIQEVFV